MTPKEKAKALIDRFLKIEIWIDETDNSTYSHKINLEEAKQCALICIDEMLRYTDWSNIKFLQEVKQEIERL